jgi:hypothetical protein
MVHDVMAAIVAALDGRVEAVEVTDLREGAFLAAISIAGPGGSRRVGSRPSDAIAVAARTGAPVFVSDAVLDVAGTLPSPDESTTVDPAAIDATIDSFRSFLDTVEPTDFIDTAVSDVTDDESSATSETSETSETSDADADAAEEPEELDGNG